MDAAVAPAITDDIFDLEPGTLQFAAPNRTSAFVNELYRAYREELIALTKAMADKRETMIADGYSADFSDRESELLYLFIRHFRPRVLVEMSPCHGYSTNYILAALTANGFGHVHSYEITAGVRGKPVEQVIRDNLLPGLDAARLTLHVGDASKADFPACDFAFIDSNHEPWFAASYLQRLVPRAKLCFAHDIVIRHRGGLVPKAPFLGIRESAQVLQSLFENNRRLIAVAALDLPAASPGLAQRLPASERSIVFAGHEQSADALTTQRVQPRIAELAHMAIVGDRTTAVDETRQLVVASPPFAALCAGLLFPLLGYRLEDVRDHFSEAYKALLSAVDREPFTVSTFNAALELGSRLRGPSFVVAAHRRAKASRIAKPTVAALFSGYRAQSYQLAHWTARVASRLGL